MNSSPTCWINFVVSSNDRKNRQDLNTIDTKDLRPFGSIQKNSQMMTEYHDLSNQDLLAADSVDLRRSKEVASPHNILANSYKNSSHSKIDQSSIGHKEGYRGSGGNQ